MTINRLQVRVTVPAGVVGVCVVFQQQVKGEPDTHFPDGMYAPMVCWGYDEVTTGPDTQVIDWSLIEKYETPWLVWGVVDFGHHEPIRNPDGSPTGNISIVVDRQEKTNVMEVIPLNQTKPRLHKRISNRQRRRIMEGAVEYANKSTMLLLATLAQCGGEVLLKQSTLDLCMQNSGELGYEMVAKTKPCITCTVSNTFDGAPISVPVMNCGHCYGTGQMGAEEYTLRLLDGGPIAS
jgi:hypothetical protein